MPARALGSALASRRARAAAVLRVSQAARSGVAPSCIARSASTAGWARRRRTVASRLAWRPCTAACGPAGPPGWVDRRVGEQQPHHRLVAVLRGMTAAWRHSARLVGVDRRVGEQQPHHRLVAVQRGHEQRRGAILPRLVGVDRRVGEQQPHHRLVAVLRGDVQRRGAILPRLVGVDRRVGEQQLHHRLVAVLRGDVQRRVVRLAPRG